MCIPTENGSCMFADYLQKHIDVILLPTTITLNTLEFDCMIADSFKINSYNYLDIHLMLSKFCITSTFLARHK